MRADDDRECEYEHLDDLLNQRVSPSHANQKHRRMLHIAVQYQRFQTQEPNEDFARSLEDRILAENDRLAHSALAGQAAAAEWNDEWNEATADSRGAIAVSRRRGEPTATLGGGWNVTPILPEVIPEAIPRTPSIARRERRAPIARRWRLIGALASAAAILLVSISAAWFMVASASPSSPLYAIAVGLVSLENNSQTQQTHQQQPGAVVESDAQHQLARAQDALTLLESTIGQSNRTAYLAALASFQTAYRAAVVATASLPAGDQHTSLATQLQTLHVSASSDLHRALVGMAWSDRLTTMQTLAALGDPIPSISRATYGTRKIVANGGQTGSGSTITGTTSGSSAGRNTGLVIRVTGSGFMPGATLYINGKPAGKIRKLTANEIQAVLLDVSTLAPGTLIGVSNPDGTAAQATASSANASSLPGSPTATTPGLHASH